MYNIIQHPYNKIKRKFDIKKALYKATFGIFMILQLSNYRIKLIENRKRHNNIGEKA